MALVQHGREACISPFIACKLCVLLHLCHPYSVLIRVSGYDDLQNEVLHYVAEWV
jgi:hypothetical protein